MSEVRQTWFGAPGPQEADSRLSMEDHESFPTPGEIGGQIARVIAVCLGLGLLARVLVTFTGMQ